MTSLISHSLGHLQIINQLALPHKTEYVDIRGVEDGHAAIASMMVRGAPAIAVVAALSLSVELNNKELLMNGSAKAAAEFILDKLEFLKTSRPTAVNLFIAARELGDLVQNISTSSSSAHHVITAYQTAAHDMLAKDLADNKAIGQHGAEFILSTSSSSSTHGVSILTHCNT